VPEDAARALMTLIVRITREPRGRLSGIVERVKTGEKERFTSVDALAGIIARMVEQDPDGRRR
jgi:hypothetical protein